MILIAEAIQDASGTHVGIGKKMEIEAGTGLEHRPVPMVRTPPWLPTDDRRQRLPRPMDADPQWREDARRKRREKCLGEVGTLCRSLAREAQRYKAAWTQPTR